MPTEFESDMHDLVADVRAVSAALAGPSSGFAVNAQVGISAYARGPWHAVFVATQIAAIRLFQIEKSRQGQGLPAMPFPEERLLEGAARPTTPRRTTARQDCVAVLKEWVNSPPEREPIQGLVDKHGVAAFMQMVWVANITGTMLAEIDPDFEDLADLLQKEALADELDWDASTDDA